MVATTTDALGGTTAFTSAAQTIANVNDAPTGEVTISGTASQGQMLTAGNTLADADGIAAGAISYQWSADGTTINGATSAVYFLTASDVGKLFTVTASYTDGFGYYESKTSGATATVTDTTPVDTTVPHVAFIEISDTALKLGDSANVKITFSEAVTLGASAVSMPDCTLVDAWTTYDNGINWYASYTPTAGVEKSNLALTVGTDFTDLAGNTALTGKSKSYSIDTLAPTVTSILLDSTTLGQGGVGTATATVTFTFSEVVKNFANNDLYVPNGVLTGLAPDGGGSSGKVWKATLTPNANTEVAGNYIQLWGDSVSDLAGNSNTDAFTSTQAYHVSTSAPTLIIGSTATGLHGGQAVTISFNFSSDPGSTFDWNPLDPTNPTNDIVVSGGALGAIQGSGAFRWATFTSGSTDGTASIDVKADSYQDAYGHNGAAGHLITPIFIDTMAPLPVSDIRFNTLSPDVPVNRDATVNATEAAAGFRIDGSKAVDANVTLPGQQIVVDSPTTWHVILDQNTITSYGQGEERLVVTTTDGVGNFSDAVINLNVDKVGPAFSSPGVALAVDTNGAGIANSVALYTATSAEAGVSFRLDTGGDSGLFKIDAATGVVKFGDSVATQTYLSPGDAGGNHVYDFNVIATDTNGNGSTQAVHLTLGANKIAVYTSQTVHDTSTWVGNLIAPVMVDGGEVYYYWDYSGDGAATNAAGTEPVTGLTTSHTSDVGLTHTYLNSILNQNLAGDATSAVIDETYRFGHLYTRDGTALHVALPTAGFAPGDATPQGTPVGTAAPDAAKGSVEINNTYDGLAAIWDAYNGTGTASAVFNSGTRIDGSPPEWAYSTFASATPRGWSYGSIYLIYGWTYENGGGVVALQVL